MPEDEHKQVPTTIKEVGIHVGYIREDISELKDIVKEMKDSVVTRSEFDNYKKAHAKEHEEINKKLNKKPWAAIFLSSALTLVMTSTIIYVVNDILSGGK